jgi:ABC-type branched-subunit amino acid transport system substrate-binding protein
LEVAFVREYDGDEELATALGEAATTDADVLMGGNVGETIPHVVEVMRNAEVAFPSYGWFEIDEPALLEHRDELEGMTGFGLWLPTMPFAGNRRFVHDFTHRWESEYPDEPIGLLLDHHSSAGYAAAQLTRRAVETAGTLEPEEVRDALFAMDTSTVFGPYRLDERGMQVGKEVPVVRYRHGLREVVDQR